MMTSLAWVPLSLLSSRLPLRVGRARASRASRVIVLLALMAPFAASCSDDVTTTNPSGVPSVAGVWTGTYRVKMCTATAGQTCAALTAPTAPHQPLRLSLQQTNDHVVGNVEFSGWYTRSLIVNGIVQSDGGVVLTGDTTFTDPTCPTVPNRLVLVTWTSLLNRAHDGMTGEFRMTATPRVTACVFAEVAIDADTVQLARP